MERALALLETVIADAGTSSIAAMARREQMPVATAHRQVTTLAAEGYLVRTQKGRYLAGPRLLDLLGKIDQKQVIAEVAAPLLDQLAAQLKTVVQLGTFENEMVTYRIKTGSRASELFTKVGMQLEAYCSGIGKALLAHLPDPERNAYLAAGPFPALTENTVTCPETLHEVLRQVRQDGFAFDRGEILESVNCVAVPIHDNAGVVHAAISASFVHAAEADKALPLVMNTARAIGQAAFGLAIASPVSGSVDKPGQDQGIPTR